MPIRFQIMLLIIPVPPMKSTGINTILLTLLRKKRRNSLMSGAASEAY